MSNSRDVISEEIEFYNDDIKLSGTLTYFKDLQTPSIILLSGYGPMTREYQTSDFKRYDVLRDFFNRNNIATLQFDDRGCGKSSKINWHDYTFQDLANDACSAYNYLQESSKVDNTKIGFLGHSLGATISTMAGVRCKNTAFVVAIAGHGLVGLETALNTRKAIAKAMGEAKEEINEWDALLRKYLTDINEEKHKQFVKEIIEKSKAKYKSQLKNKQFSEENFQKYIQMRYEGFLMYYGSSEMYKSFLKYNPKEDYSKVQFPILLIFADNDVMHPMNIHKPQLQSYLEKNKQNTSIIEFQADHVFMQKENQKVIGFIPKFKEQIYNWIKQTLDE